MSRKQSATAYLAEQLARKTVAEQTRARIMMGFDAAIIAAGEMFGLNPDNAAEFCEAYNTAINELAEMYINDCEENRDKQIWYAKGKRDEAIRRIVGEKNFVPFDKAYGEAYIDELKRIRIMRDDRG